VPHGSGCGLTRLTATFPPSGTNDGAACTAFHSRLVTKARMPLGNDLNDDDAFDVAAFIN
jgi:cytochrome c